MTLVSDEIFFLVASSETMENRQVKTRPTRKSKTYWVTSVFFLQLELGMELLKLKTRELHKQWNTRKPLTLNIYHIRESLNEFYFILCYLNKGFGNSKVAFQRVP